MLPKYKVGQIHKPPKAMLPSPQLIISLHECVSETDKWIYQCWVFGVCFGTDTDALYSISAPLLYTINIPDFIYKKKKGSTVVCEHVQRI